MLDTTVKTLHTTPRRVSDNSPGKQWRLPHNLEAATRILQRRKELLGESVS